MNQIEQLAIELFQLPYFTQQLRYHVRDITNAPTLCPPDSQPTYSLQHIVDQITTSIAELAEIGSEEGEVLRVNRQKQAEDDIRRQISKEAEERCCRMEESLRQEVKKLESMLGEQLRDSSRSEPTQNLKLQRKLIAKSILEASRLNSPKSFKSSFSPRLEKTKTDTILTVESDDPFIEEEGENCLPLKSELRVGQCRGEDRKERQERMAMETVKNETNRELESLRELAGDLKTDSSKMKEEFNNKLDSNLESLWNVISDLSTRLCKVQFP